MAVTRMIRRTIAFAALAVALLAGLAPPAHAQRKGEYLSDEELEVIRDYQQDIGKRAEAFLTVADRRLAVLADAAAKPEGRLSKAMGDLRTGSPVELLDDYRHSIEELMVKLEDDFERKGLSDALKKALTLAVERTDLQIQKIESLKPKLTSPDAAQFATKAIESARELNAGAKAALATK
jgi:hypothetical protein